MAEKLYLVDGPSYLYRAYHAIGHLSTSRGIPTNATLGMTMMLWKILREERPTYMAIAWDAPGPTFRHQQFEAYKIQRPGMPKDLVDQLPWVRTSLEALGLPILELSGYEADDILATAVARLHASPVELVLVTADKDALQLVGPKVSVLSVLGRTGERVVYDEARVVERWGVPPARIPDVLGLMGDAIDNIPGVPGVGEVTAQKLLRQFGSLEALYGNLAVVSGAKLREALGRYRDQAFFSRQLAVLDAGTPVEIDLERFRVRDPDWERLRALWTELEFSSLLRQLPARAVAVPSAAVPRVDAAGWAAWLGRAGDLVAVEPVVTGSPPDLQLLGLAGYSPAAGPCYVAEPPAVPEGLRLVGHDVKALCGILEARGRALPPARLEDTAVAAYLLNSGRTGYPLEQLCPEAVGEAPPGPLETLLEGKAPAEADPGLLAAWAGARAEGVWRLWESQRPLLERDGLLPLYRDLELPLVPVLAAMEAVGIRVAPERLELLAKELERQLDALLREIHTLAGEPVNPNSPKQLAVVLFEKLKLPPLKRTKTGYSTDVDVLEELALGHPLPQKILEYRQLAKLKGTYADALPVLVHPRTGRIHTSFNQLVAATGRLSSSNPNLMNIPIRSELGLRIRRAFIPEEGWRFLAADYSQIELRVFAHLSGEEALVEAFRRDEDIHTRTAVEILRVPPAEVTPDMRRLAKVVNFGILYGISGFGLAQAARISREDAQRYIDGYFAAHPKVRAYIDRTVAEGRERGYVTTLLGRRRYLPELTSRNAQVRAAAERMAANAPIQGSASDIIKLAMVRLAAALAERGLGARMLLQVHDELLFEVPEAERERVRALVREIMESVMRLDVPLRVDVKEGRDWSQV
ncbi:MAG: DNA polymerase I [Candidatus Rokubacteria bacterium]|nr:DNA polymerase I [Candidatus Rokubacteria bacterium]